MPESHHNHGRELPAGIVDLFYKEFTYPVTDSRGKTYAHGQVGMLAGIPADCPIIRDGV